MAVSSASRVFSEKAPTRSTWAPFFSQAPRTSGTGDSVAQDTMSASRTASSRSSAMAVSMPPADNAKAVEIACERVRFHKVTRVMGRTMRWARMRCGAKAPAPIMTRCEASSRAR